MCLLYTAIYPVHAVRIKMAAMLQIPQVFPRVSCLGSAKVVQCPRPGPKIGNKSQQIPRYSPVCPRGQPPGMAADKCIITRTTRRSWVSYSKDIQITVKERSAGGKPAGPVHASKLSISPFARLRGNGCYQNFFQSSANVLERLAEDDRVLDISALSKFIGKFWVVFM